MTCRALFYLLAVVFAISNYPPLYRLTLQPCELYHSEFGTWLRSQHGNGGHEVSRLFGAMQLDETLSRLVFALVARIVAKVALRMDLK